MNNIILTGRLTKDVEMRYIPVTGTPVATFTLAVDRDYLKKDGTRDTDFIPVEVIGKVAEFCKNYLSKGRLVAVQGSIRVDRYQDKNTQEFKIEVYDYDSHLVAPYIERNPTLFYLQHLYWQHSCQYR